MTLLETRALSVSIAGRAVCRDLDLRIEAGQCWGILGRNGAGKTTLLKTLAGLYAADGGEVLLEGRNLVPLARAEVARRLGVLFQEHVDLFPGTVLETALIGRHPFLKAWQWEDASDVETALAALAAVQLEGLAGRDIASLSGGERQRLEIATLLTQSPQVFLLDEPTNHLDLHHQIRILERLRDLARARDKAMVMILHDVNLVARFCDHVVLLFGEGETAQGTTEEMLEEQGLARLYGHPMRAVADARQRLFVAG